MRAIQVTVAFHQPALVQELAEVLRRHYGDVEVGEGMLVNGLPVDWIVVSNDRPKRLD